MHRDVNRIKVSMDFDYKTEIFKASYNTAIIIMQLITWNGVNCIIVRGHVMVRYD